MKLEKLAKEEPAIRNIMSLMLLTDKEYLKAIKKGLPFFTQDELNKIEENEEYKSGLTFEEINKLLSEKGMILKLPTFKKYVNLKLIPTSTKRKTTGKGSPGLYPASVIRTINFIKYSLYANIDAFETVVGGFETRALEVIENSFEIGNFFLIDFLVYVYSDPRFKDEPQTVIKRCADELFDKKVINHGQRDEIIQTTDRVDTLIHEADDAFHKLLHLLGEIKVSGPLGLGMLLKTHTKKE